MRNLLTVVQLVCCGIWPLSEGLQSFCPSCSSITTRGYHEGKDSVPFFSVLHVQLRIWALTIIIKRLNSQRTYYVSGSLLNSLYRLSHLILSKRPHEVHSTAIPNWQAMLSSLLPTVSFKPKQSGSGVHSLNRPHFQRLPIWGIDGSEDISVKVRLSKGSGQVDRINGSRS